MKMKLRRVAPTNGARAAYAGSYLGHRVEIWHIGRGDWTAWVDGQPEHFDSLDRARREVARVIEYHAGKRALANV